ncbi:MAG: hypothetical protein UR98_C0002G0050 [Parcubacteria group bacterium GW2011_GWA1_36_12]|nr:MAG: hypothetical protein UR98_C0002G0050 [Parcubacteria group bacterium GW2011_GWA1_36_12]
MPEEIEESQEPQETEEIQESGGAMNLLSPEGLVMMSVAVVIDLIGLIIVCVGLDDFGITDIIGMIFIGSWMFFRSGAMPERKTPSKKSKGAGKTAERNVLKRFGLTGLAELIPYLGALPWWTIMVYKELTES